MMKKPTLTVKIACLSAAVAAVSLLLAVVRKCSLHRHKELDAHE